VIEISSLIDNYSMKILIMMIEIFPGVAGAFPGKVKKLIKVNV